MRLIAFTAFIAFLFSGTTVFAQAYTSSEFEHQTNKGIFELTPLVGAGTVHYKGRADERTTVSSATNSLFNVGLKGEYGLSESISIGLALGYEKDNYSVTAVNSSANLKGDGMIDPQLYFNGRANLGGGLIRYGADLRFSLGKAQISYPSGSGNIAFNQYNGGITFTPFVGYELSLGGPSTLGVRLSYDLIQTDRQVTAYSDFTGASTNEKIKGGNEMTAIVFYEMNMKPLLLGVDVGLRNFNTTQEDDGDGAGLNKQNNNYTAPKADIYAAYNLADNLVVIPQIGYDTPNGGAQAGRLNLINVNNSGGLYGDVALRIAF